MMTPEEREAENAKWEAGKEQRDWDAEISNTDKDITARVVEDMYDVLSATAKGKMPAETRAVFEKRKEIRSRKPE